jgi:RNA polymerase sigma-70 factor, ECF subfamily
MTTSASLTLDALADEAGPADVIADDEHLAWRGDATGFGMLYERYLSGVYGYLSNRVRTREVAEDLTSEVLRSGR